ncbi:MAG: ECF transporter S component [Gemmiger sp.]|nr:ECF transporter S component [Gemmiger sp.]
MQTKSYTRVHTLTVTAMLGAVATVLMFLDFSVPFMPSFVKLDVSELPALLAAFALGPVPGVTVCFIKNLFAMIFHGSTGGVGELCNFFLGAALVVPAGLIYRKNRNRKGAVLGAAVGAICMAVLSVPINFFITYPMYVNLYGMPLDAILGMYKAIWPGAGGLLSCLLVFNMPFTLLKGVLDAVLAFLIYKPLSPILHGKKQG